MLKESSRGTAVFIVVGIILAASMVANVYQWNQQRTLLADAPSFNDDYQELLKTKSEADAQNALIAQMKENPNILSVERQDGVYPGIKYEYCESRGGAEDSWDNLKNVE